MSILTANTMLAGQNVISYLEGRYVDRAKLNALLQTLFGQSYSVVVSAGAEEYSTWLNRYLLTETTCTRSLARRSQWRGQESLRRLRRDRYREVDEQLGKGQHPRKAWAE
ncbi:hypothetical protein F4777DRAFT_404221 [Nemania sp. FL0916]|nr:hypothetical protein F4777DRAFT_404221 [Nemania sp. FL0916]